MNATIHTQKISNKTKTPKNRGFKKATTRFELVMTVLQTGALPLGYVAVYHAAACDNVYIIAIVFSFVKDFL